MQEPPPLAGMDEKAEVVLTLEEAKGLDGRTVDLRGGKGVGVKGQLVKVEDRAVGRVERCAQLLTVTRPVRLQDRPSLPSLL